MQYTPTPKLVDPRDRLQRARQHTLPARRVLRLRAAPRVPAEPATRASALTSRRSTSTEPSYRHSRAGRSADGVPCEIRGTCRNGAFSRSPAISTSSAASSRLSSAPAPRSMPCAVRRAIAGDVIPHRYVFYSATDGDVAALERAGPEAARPRARHDRHAEGVAVGPDELPARRPHQPRRRRRRARSRRVRHRAEAADRRHLRHREVPARGHAGALRAAARLRGPRQGDRDRARLRRGGEDAPPGAQRDRLRCAKSC